MNEVVRKEKLSEKLNFVKYNKQQNSKYSFMHLEEKMDSKQ